MASNPSLSSDSSVDDLLDNSDNYSESSSELSQQTHSTKYLAESDTHSFFHFDNQNAINLLHINCRSIASKVSDLQNLLSAISGKITAIGVTETWLAANTEDTINLPGYKFFPHSRDGKTAGGVGFFISDNINVVKRKDLYRLSSFIECLFVELISDKSNCLIGCVYRPPNTDVALFNLELLSILQLIDGERHCISAIMGDFNLDLIKNGNHAPTNEFLNNLLSHSFLPTIHNPTRITDSTATLIDNIFINETQFVCDSAIICNDISDHFPIAVHIENSLFKKKFVPAIKKTRSFDSNSIVGFKTALANTDWSEINTLAAQQSDPSGAYDCFHAKYLALFNTFFPAKPVKLSYKHTPRQPWMTDGLLNSCIKKSKLYKKYRQKNSLQSKNRYIAYRNKLKSILRRAEQSYYREQVQIRAGNIRLTWKLLNLVINKKTSSEATLIFSANNKLISDGKEIADNFNDFFTNVGSNLAKTIPNSTTSMYSYLRSSPSSSFSIFPTSPDEIVRVVSNFPNKCSSGFDEIPLHLMKATVICVADPLSKVVNSCFQNGIFPELLKIAKVCPVFKDGDAGLFTNYRPISVLPSFSKIFEKLISVRLILFLENNHILSPHQYGFRKNHSTFMAIADMYDKVSSAIDENKFSMGIFIDLSKAFDTIDHSILEKKLEFYGIRGLPLNLLKSYLSNRKQYVAYNGVSSNLSNISCGVPQGSILGPLLFILYVNDMANASSILHFILFADDTNLFCSNLNFHDLVCTVNQELSKLCEWFCANKLSLNVKKTNYIIFGNKILPVGHEDMNICLDGMQISRVEWTKFLGVHIDEKLNWQKHVTHVSKKISAGIGILSRAKKILPFCLLRLLYFALIYPYLTYCNIIWGSACQQSVNCLIVLQKRVVRIITGSPYLASTSSIFARLKLLKFTDIRKVQAAIFMCRFKFGLLPVACQHYFQFTSQDRRYDLRRVTPFQIPFSRTEVRKNSINVYGPELWDRLPFEIQNSSSLFVLKRGLINLITSSYIL